MIRRFALVLVAVLSLGLARPAAAAVFANQVISYTTGAGTAAAFRNPLAALGSPDDITGEVLGFPSGLTPFSPAFESDELVQIGGGGQITLAFPNRVNIIAGLEIGVVENVGLIDSSFPNGTPGSTASTFGEDSAVVEVSRDGVTWFVLNGGNPILFNLPAMYHSDSQPYDPGTLTADFGQPFAPAGGLAAFNGLTYPQIKTLFNGSGGGTWLDLSSTGLPDIDFIRFSVPIGGWVFDLDAVMIANGAVGVVVPEPSALVLATIGAAALLFARFRKLRLEKTT